MGMGGRWLSPMPRLRGNKKGCCRTSRKRTACTRCEKVTAKVIYVTFGKANAEKAYELYTKASEIDDTQLEEAEFLYREAIRLDPSLDIAYTNLGNIRYRRGYEEEAERLYVKALEIYDNQPEAHYNLGYVMLERGEEHRAVPYFEKAIIADPRFAGAYFNLAMALRRTGNTSAAKVYWRRFLELEPAGTYSDIARAELGLRVVKHRAPKPAP
jgi:tetratricopeptide (TPR) repeat protein